MQLKCLHVINATCTRLQIVREFAIPKRAFVVNTPIDHWRHDEVRTVSKVRYLVQCGQRTGDCDLSHGDMSRAGHLEESLVVSTGYHGVIQYTYEFQGGLWAGCTLWPE
jgi:hypothetical protein